MMREKTVIDVSLHKCIIKQIISTLNELFHYLILYLQESNLSNLSCYPLLKINISCGYVKNLKKLIHTCNQLAFFIYDS